VGGSSPFFVDDDVLVPRNLNYCCKKKRIHGLQIFGCLLPITIMFLG